MNSNRAFLLPAIYLIAAVPALALPVDLGQIGQAHATEATASIALGPAPEVAVGLAAPDAHIDIGQARLLPATPPVGPDVWTLALTDFAPVPYTLLGDPTYPPDPPADGVEATQGIATGHITFDERPMRDVGRAFALTGALAVVAGAIAATRGAAWGGLARRAVAALPLLLGFSRIDEGQLLRSPVRARLHGLITADPGITMTRLMTLTDIGWGTTVYHLRRMESAGILVSQREGRERRFWIATAPEARLRRRTKVLRRDTPRRIAALVAEQPGLNQTEIRERLALGLSVASHHLGTLVEAGLVDVAKAGRSRIYTPADELETVWSMAGASA